MAKTEIRMTGSGGQGVIMGTIILAEAAYEDGKRSDIGSRPITSKPIPL